PVTVVLATFLLLLACGALMYLVVPVGWYLRAASSGVKLNALRYLMRLTASGVSPATFVDALVAAQRAGVTVDLRLLEAHELAGGDPLTVLHEATRLARQGETVDLSTLCADDLARGTR
ncbi:MAG: flotillin-like FloA family protein, partial [Bacteroidota bacterium]